MVCLLTACGLVVIATNLAVSIRVTADYGASTAVTLAWSRRMGEWDELARLAAAIHAPASENAVQGARDDAEAPLESARKHFDAQMQQARQSVEREVAVAVAAPLVEQFSAVERDVNVLTMTARRAIEIPPTDAAEQARELRTLNRHLAAVEASVRELQARGRRVWRDDIQAQFGAAQSTTRWGGAVTFVMVAVFAASVWLVRWFNRNVRAAQQSSRAIARQLRKQQSHLEDFIDDAPIGAHSLDAEGRVLWANDFELNLLGYTAEQYVGRRWTEFHDNPAAGQALFTRVKSGEAVRSVSLRLRHRNGEIRHVQIDSAPVTVEGTFVQTRCFLRDVTAQVEAAADSRAADKRFQSLAEHAPIATFRTDRWGQFVYVSEYICLTAGCRTTEEFTQNWREMLHPEDRERVTALWKSVTASGADLHCDHRFQHADGRITWASVVAVPVRNDLGEVVEYVGTLSDVSERRAAELQANAARDARTRTGAGDPEQETLSVTPGSAFQPSAPAPMLTIDRQAVMTRIGNDEDLLHQLVDLYSAGYPTLLGDIRTAVHVGDAHQLRHAAHALRGSVANFGPNPAFETAGELEQMGRNGELAEAPDTLARLELALQQVDRALEALVD